MVDFRPARAGILTVILLTAATSGFGADLEDVQKLFKAGKYSETIDAASKAIDGNQWGEGWWQLKIRAQLATGQYAEALKTYESSLERYDGNLTLRLLGWEALRFNDRPEAAEAVLERMRALAERVPWRYTDVSSRVALGRALLRSGADARQVLELFYDKAKKESPDSAEPYLASGDLALDKSDYGLAAEAFAEAVKREPDNPDAYVGLARSYDNDAERATKALSKALELNPKHVDALLFQVDNLVDREEYAQAEAILKKALEVNAQHPLAWAYRAVLAHLAGDKKQEEAHRGEALSTWTTSPEVDSLIGLKLSQKYRFAE